MENKFKNYLSNRLIFNIARTSNIINIKDNQEKAIEVFNQLDEKYKFYRLFQELEALDKTKCQYVNQLILQDVMKAKKNNEEFNLNLITIQLRSCIHEAKQEKGLESEAPEELEKKKYFTPYSFKDFLSLDDKKIYYVNRMFAANTINMIFAPPKNMKSFISYYLALCISTGSDFFKQRTKKVNVCYFDWENPVSDVQNRLKGICKGMEFDTSKIDGLFFFPKQHSLIRVERYETIVYPDLKDELIEFIKDNDIKVIFFDTLRRLGNFEENDSGTINTIKSDLFDPIMNETGVCIIFLHHTSKEGTNYRGSVDIEGIVDTSYKIKKLKKADFLDIVMTCEARRNNEIDKITSSVTITNNSYLDDNGDMIEDIDEVIFEKKDNFDSEDDNNYGEYRKVIIEKLNVNEEYMNKELTNVLKDNCGINSSNTINKIIAWLTKIDVLIKTGFNKSIRYSLNPQHKNEEVGETFHEKQAHTRETIEYELHKMFLENDVISNKTLINDQKENLNGLFNIEYIAPILNDWNKKGWLNLVRKSEIRVTEKYKEVHQQ